MVLDPVSVPKAARLLPLFSADRPIFAITPNREELQALTGRDTAKDESLADAAAVLHERGVRHVWISTRRAGQPAEHARGTAHLGGPAR